MIGEVVGILGDVANMISSNNSNAKTQKMIDGLKNVISPALLESLNMVDEQSNQGLAGYENIVSETKGRIPSTLNQIRDAVNSGEMMDTVTNLYTKQNETLNQLAVANAQIKTGNKEKLSGFLANDLAPAQDKQRHTDFGLTIGKDEVRQQGVKDNQSYLADILGKVGGSADGGNGWLDNIFGGGGSGEGSSSPKPTGGVVPDSGSNTDNWMNIFNT